MKPRYFVWTWDEEKQDFTPQIGVRCGPWSKWGLRRALRSLREMGYDTTRAGGVCLLVRSDESNCAKLGGQR